MVTGPGWNMNGEYSLSGRLCSRRRRKKPGGEAVLKRRDGTTSIRAFPWQSISTGDFRTAGRQGIKREEERDWFRKRIRSAESREENSQNMQGKDIFICGSKPENRGWMRQKAAVKWLSIVWCPGQQWAVSSWRLYRKEKPG